MKAKLSLAFFLLLVVALVACGPEQIALGGTRGWIDLPRDHAVLHLAAYQVIAHGSDAGGLRQVELLVNGVSIGAMNCENLAQPLVTCRGVWNPPSPGDYRLEARVTNASGGVGTSAPVNVSIGGTTVTPTITRTPTTSVPPANPTTTTPTQSPGIIVPPGIVPPAIITPTFTPTPSRTPTLPSVIAPPVIISPTSTRTTTIQQPAPQIQFWADDTTLTAGQCTMLRWRTEYVTAVYLDNQPDVGDADRQVCPSSTTTYTLRVDYAGGSTNRQVVIQVSAPPSRTPTRTPTRTLTPQPVPPAAPYNLRVTSRSCASPYKITIAWDSNSNNETGFRIERRRPDLGTDWSYLATPGTNTTQYTDGSITKTGSYDYRVRAQNDAGNSAWTSTVHSGGCVD